MREVSAGRHWRVKVRIGTHRVGLKASRNRLADSQLALPILSIEIHRDLHYCAGSALISSQARKRFSSVRTASMAASITATLSTKSIAPRESGTMSTGVTELRSTATSERGEAPESVGKSVLPRPPGDVGRPMHSPTRRTRPLHLPLSGHKRPGSGGPPGSDAEELAVRPRTGCRRVLYQSAGGLMRCERPRGCRAKARWRP